MKLEYFVDEYDYVYDITVAFNTLDRDTGGPMKLFIYYHFFKDDYSKIEALRVALKNAVSHEIDECLYQDNIRVFDPHKGSL